MLNSGEATIDEYEMGEGIDEVPDSVENYAKSAQSTFWLTLATYILPFLTPVVWFALGYVTFKRANVLEAEAEVEYDETNERGTRLRDGNRYFTWAVAAHAVFLVAFAIAMVLLPALAA